MKFEEWIKLKESVAGLRWNTRDIGEPVSKSTPVLPDGWEKLLDDPDWVVQNKGILVNAADELEKRVKSYNPGRLNNSDSYKSMYDRMMLRRIYSALEVQ